MTDWQFMKPYQKIEAVWPLAEQNYSALEIGLILGCSRNSVISVCWRNRIQLKGPRGKRNHLKPSERRSGPAKQPYNGGRRRKPAKPSKSPKIRKRPMLIIAKENIPPLNGTGIPFIDRRPNQCVWIFNNDMKNAICCGREVMEGHSYCQDHAARACSRPLFVEEVEQAA